MSSWKNIKTLMKPCMGPYMPQGPKDRNKMTHWDLPPKLILQSITEATCWQPLRLAIAQKHWGIRMTDWILDVTDQKSTICNTLWMLAKSLQSCVTLWNLMNWSLQDSYVHGILQERILELVALPSSRESSWPRDPTAFLMSPALAGMFFTASTTWEVHETY